MKINGSIIYEPMEYFIYENIQKIAPKKEKKERKNTLRKLTIFMQHCCDHSSAIRTDFRTYLPLSLLLRSWVNYNSFPGVREIKEQSEQTCLEAT